jgi:type II secretory pathway pseudopilin PulG
MTLLEVLVSLSIGAIVIAAVLAVLSTSQRAREQGEARSDLFQAARITLQQIERDLRTAVTRANDPSFTFSGTNQDDNGVPIDELEFAAASGQPAASRLPTSSLVHVKYAIGNLRDSPQPGLLREELGLPMPDPISSDQEELATRMYCPGAIGFDVLYYDPTAQQWVEEWQNQPSPPSAAQVILYVVPLIPGQEAEAQLADAIPFTTTVRLALAGAPLGGSTTSGQSSAGQPAAGGLPMPGMPSLPGLPTPGGLGGGPTPSPGGATG